MHGFHTEQGTQVQGRLPGCQEVRQCGAGSHHCHHNLCPGWSRLCHWDVIGASLPVFVHSFLFM